VLLDTTVPLDAGLSTRTSFREVAPLMKKIKLQSVLHMHSLYKNVIIPWNFGGGLFLGGSKNKEAIEGIIIIHQ
jgi:hypothetical protein